MGKKRTATRFLKGFGALLGEKARTDTRLLPVVEAFDAALKGRIGKSPGTQPNLPLFATVDALLDAATADGPEIRDLLRATHEGVAWYQCYPQSKRTTELADGLIAAHVVGSRGILKSDDLITGFFLIGPHVDYPLHDHVADELYYVVAGQVDIQNGFGCPPRTVRPGEYSVTPSGMPHRLKTGAEPVLIVFAWTGTVACDVFWWEHDRSVATRAGSTVWRRFVPPRTIAPKAG